MTKEAVPPKLQPEDLDSLLRIKDSWYNPAHIVNITRSDHGSNEIVVRGFGDVHFSHPYSSYDLREADLIRVLYTWNKMLKKTPHAENDQSG